MLRCGPHIDFRRMCCLNRRRMDTIYDTLKGKERKIPVGVNIAKTHNPEILGTKAIEDICYSFEKLYPLADYITLNISCPNTAEGKTFEECQSLEYLLTAIDKLRKDEKPILIKVSPDISYEDLKGIISVGKKHNIDGYVVSNTSSQRDIYDLKTPREKIEKIGKGGLSGKPIESVSTRQIARAYACIQEIYADVDYSKRPKIIGVGGIDNAESAYRKIEAGASLVQVMSALPYEGPGLVKEINSGLSRILKNNGYSHLKDAVGKNYGKYL